MNSASTMVRTAHRTRCPGVMGYWRLGRMVDADGDGRMSWPACRWDRSRGSWLRGGGDGFTVLFPSCRLPRPSKSVAINLAPLSACTYPGRPPSGRWRRGTAGSTAGRVDTAVWAEFEGLRPFHCQSCGPCIHANLTLGWCELSSLAQPEGKGLILLKPDSTCL